MNWVGLAAHITRGYDFIISVILYSAIPDRLNIVEWGVAIIRT